MTRRSMFGRACSTAARVFAMDRTLARAFEQIDADARVERAQAQRWVMWRAWLALARTICLGVPAAMVGRVLALTGTERAVVLRVCAAQVAWIALAAVPAWWLGTRARLDILAPWAYLISNAAGVQVVRLTAGPQRAGALAALIGVTVPLWAAALLMEVMMAVDTSPDSATVLMRGVLLPVMAAQVIWLSALATMAGRSTLLSLPQAGLVTGAWVVMAYFVWPRLSPAVMTPAGVMGLVGLTVVVTAVASAWIARVGPRVAAADGG